MSIEQARAKLGDLVIAAMNGQTTTLTRYGRPVARIVPIKERTMTETTYTAAIGLVSSVVAGDHCDVSVAKNDVVGYHDDEDGNEAPQYAMGNKVVLGPVETSVRTDEDVAAKVYDAADEVLAANGWRRVGDWDDTSGDTAYVTVERA